VRVDRIRAADTRSLRQSVLTPNERVEDLAWAHDDDADTYHAGIFEDRQLVRKHGDVFEGPHVGPGPHFVMSFDL
jgi:hypothetical protein